MSGNDGRSRVVIEGVSPEIDGGRFAAKDTVGDRIDVEADIFTDGHDAIAAVLLYRHESESDWREVPMRPLVNDRWRGHFPASQMGTWVFTLQAWVDRFTTWQRDFRKRVAAHQDVSVDLLSGANLVEEAARRADGAERDHMRHLVHVLRDSRDHEDRLQVADSQELAGLMSRHAERHHATSYGREVRITVDRERARFSAWYEMFPRSCATEPDRHGTLRDAAARLPYVADMGFDVVYLPPIHPIGEAFRKGPNNRLNAHAGDPGSPWAIGGSSGGHKAIHPQLGTMEDFHFLVSEAQRQGMEIALDIAFQCSPDHPYVREHPDWFRQRPDGTIQYAENPPKKYQDIYPFDFECADWQGLWRELKSVFTFWIDQGVKIFRVDNPHTKPFPFWEWCIGEIRKSHPDVLFLAEAFTRPKIMNRLAKLGFSQSYTYFAWRHTKQELTEYLTEVTRPPIVDFFRPNLWPNTPDILTEELQYGGRAKFMSRYVLAATLGASYGIYGPTFELCIGTAREPHSEEYLDSEKYQVRHWDLVQSHSLRHFIKRVNQIRRAHPALQRNRGLRFHPVDNDQILCYSKWSEDGSDVLVVIVNLDSHHTHSGWVELPLHDLGLSDQHPFAVHDLLAGGRYMWQGWTNFVKLNPMEGGSHIFHIERQMRTEHDFDTFSR